MTLTDHAVDTLRELARRRTPNSLLCKIDSVQFLDVLGLDRGSARLLGTVVSLLDVSCLFEGLPWLGRVIIFRSPENDWTRHGNRGNPLRHTRARRR
jgi:hypothetical protein